MLPRAERSPGLNPLLNPHCRQCASDGTGQCLQYPHPINPFSSPTTFMHATQGVAVDADGNVLVADLDNRCVRCVSPAGTITTLAGGWHQGGWATGGEGRTRGLLLWVFGIGRGQEWLKETLA